MVIVAAINRFSNCFNHHIKHVFIVTVLSVSFNTLAFSDQGITNPTHKKYMAKIVWSNNIVSFNSPDESSFKNKFSLNEPIYGRVYQQKALNNYTVYNAGSSMKMRDGGYEILVYIDGKKPTQGALTVFDENNFNGAPANHWTTWQFSPYPVKRQDGDAVIADKWLKLTRGLAPGDHQIRFELYPALGQYKTKQAIAAGDFTLKVAVGEKIKSTDALPMDAYTGPDKFNLKQKIKQAMIGPVAKSSREILDVKVTSNWVNGVYKKQIPRQEYRKITGVILWHDTNDDQLCRYVSYNFVQDKLTSGWSPLRFQSFCLSCVEGNVDCP